MLLIFRFSFFRGGRNFAYFHRMLAKLKFILRKLGRFALRGVLLLLLALLLFEVLYRYQVVDTYRRELRALNPDTAPAKGGVLVMGDSFTAAQDNWVDRLRLLRPDLAILNGAVPGTGVRQANFMAGGRFKISAPKVFIYQIYVGNDLFDLRFPLNWAEMGFARNVYWGAANRLRGLSWLNYALGQFRSAPPPSGTRDGKTVDFPFSPESYASRVKLYLRAEPALLQASVLLQGARKSDFADYLEFLSELLDHCENGDCQAYLLFIPHCAQVHARYATNMQLLGAKIDDSKAISQLNYPFFEAVKGALASHNNVSCVNLLPIFRKMEVQGVPAYFNNDIHLSHAGQERLAQFVADLLRAAQ